MSKLTTVVVGTCAASLVCYGAQKSKECPQHFYQAIVLATQAVDERRLETGVRAAGHAALGFATAFAGGCCLVVGSTVLWRIASSSSANV